MLPTVKVTLEGENYITVVEVARRVGVSEETVRRWIRLGKLPARRLILNYLVLERDVEELLRRRGG